MHAGRGAPAFALRVDAPSAALAALHARERVRSSAFVTACNPLGRALGFRENARRHARLGRALGARGLARREGVGRHPTNGWPGEPSWLVLGVAPGAARALGRTLRQNALLLVGPDAVPRLVLLR